MEKLVYRHNRITRATHWINALALVILVMSGLPNLQRPSPSLLGQPFRTR